MLQQIRRFSTKPNIESIFQALDLKSNEKGCFDGSSWYANGPTKSMLNPSTNETIGQVQMGTTNDFKKALEATEKASKIWRDIPMPKRGEIIRQQRLALEQKAVALGYLVSLEMGKIAVFHLIVFKSP